MAEPTPPLIPTLVFVPSLRVDRGMGHLRRCLAAATAGGPGAAVYFAADPEFVGRHPGFEKPTIQRLADAAGVRLWVHWPADTKVDTVVCDLQSASPEAYWFLRRRSRSLVGWDDGGGCRGRFPFLVDSLPHDAEPKPNVRLPGLLGLETPGRPPRFDGPIRKVLAVFGGADPAGLTLRFLGMVAALKDQGRWPFDLTVVRGPLSRFIIPPGTEVLEAPPELSRLLGQWDLVVTSWGLTALESLAAGTPVLLFNPSSYHQKLSRAAGLPTFGVKVPRADAFLSGLEDAPGAARAAYDRLIEPPLDAGEYFRAFHGTDGLCPICRTAGHRVFTRTPHKSYHRCSSCGMEYLSVHQLPPKEYSEAYFFEDYQKQYGKTYLEDFPHIQGLGRQRLDFLDKTFGPRPGRRILDVGCAFGPFLAAVSEAGHRPFGLDVATSAVDHVRSVLGFPAAQVPFGEFSWEQAFPGEAQPDVVTLWFVIEHFPDLRPLLAKVNHLLPLGGIFAFSTPNGKGISRRFRSAQFWDQSPDDHFTIWNPQVSRSVLARFGFELGAVRITGRHPERFPHVGPEGSASRRLVSWLDRRLGWGDTFEVYARKIKELP
jgi:2-polyprenyl-3-methyl-5-hydroxy-6-metoxy-1,4-benzoquinol methylase